MLTSLHCCYRVVRDTSSWNNKKEMLEAERANCSQLTVALAELDEDGMRSTVQRASLERDEAQAACNRWMVCLPCGLAAYPNAYNKSNE